MFNLKKSVKELAARACGGWIARRNHQSEIEDYLFCVIEEKVRTGVDEQQAFEQAQRQMGDTSEIRCELKKARKSQKSWQVIATMAIASLTVAGALWQRSEVSLPTANDLLAVVVMPLEWLGLLAPEFDRK